MRKILLTSYIILFSALSFACSCDWGGNFLKQSKYSDIIIKAKIIEHIYHFENGKSLNGINKLKHELVNNENKSLPEFYESIKVEIMEVINGTETRREIEIYGSDGADCGGGVSGFDKGKIYVFAIHQSQKSEYNLPNQDETDYVIWGCSEKWLEYNPETNKVKGRIKGKSESRKKRIYDYDKLKRKIT